MDNIFSFLLNYTNWRTNLVDKMTLGYITALGFFFWPTFFSVIIVYMYLKHRSLVIAAAVILVIFAAFGNALAQVDIWVNFMYILVSLIVTFLILLFIIKRR